MEGTYGEERVDHDRTAAGTEGASRRAVAGGGRQAAQCRGRRSSTRPRNIMVCVCWFFWCSALSLSLKMHCCRCTTVQLCVPVRQAGITANKKNYRKWQCAGKKTKRNCLAFVQPITNGTSVMSPTTTGRLKPGGACRRGKKKKKKRKKRQRRRRGRLCR